MILAVLAGGALGAIARLGLTVAVKQVAGDPALGTFAVNALGCFLFGLCWALYGSTWSTAVAACVFTGFLGAFTTFSTYAFECLQMLEQGRHAAFALHLLGQNALGGLALWGGLSLGRAL